MEVFWDWAERLMKIILQKVDNFKKRAYNVFCLVSCNGAYLWVE